MADKLNTSIESLFKGMEGFFTTKTVVGDPVTYGDTIIIPLLDVSFAVGAGDFNSTGKNKAAGGLGGKITPSAVLVIQNGSSKVINIKNASGLTKVLDMVPDFVNKFIDKNEETQEKEENIEEIFIEE